MALAIARLANLELVGIMTHEGHANSAPPDEIEGIAIEAGKAMVETAERIREHGIEPCPPSASVPPPPPTTRQPSAA